MDNKQLIKDISIKFYKEIIEKGYITPGHNGPYNDDETPEIIKSYKDKRIKCIRHEKNEVFQIRLIQVLQMPLVNI